MGFTINIRHLTDPALERRLDRIETALEHLIGEFSKMTQTTDATIAAIGDAVSRETSIIDAIKAFIDANVTAQAKLTAELQAEGADIAKLQAFNDAMTANQDRLASLIVSGTPADTGAPVPEQIPSSE
jgi:hypothetical protein